MPQDTEKKAASDVAIAESRKRAGWESGNRRSGISSDKSVAEGAAYVAKPIVDRANDYARIDAKRAMSKVRRKQITKRAGGKS